MKPGLTWVTALVSRRVKSPPQTASSSSSLSRGAETATVLAAREALSTATALAHQLRSNNTRGATHTHNVATGTPLPAQTQLIVRSNTPDAVGNNQRGSEASHSASQFTGKRRCRAEKRTDRATAVWTLLWARSVPSWGKRGQRDPPPSCWIGMTGRQLSQSSAVLLIFLSIWN